MSNPNGSNHIIEVNRLNVWIGNMHILRTLAALA